MDVFQVNADQEHDSQGHLENSTVTLKDVYVKSISYQVLVHWKLDTLYSRKENKHLTRPMPHSDGCLIADISLKHCIYIVSTKLVVNIVIMFISENRTEFTC